MVVIQCGCGKRHTLAGWRALRLVGYQPADIGGVLLELRNCHCGSTIYMPMRGAAYMSRDEYERLEAKAEIIAERDEQDAEVEREPPEPLWARMGGRW